MGFYLNKRTYSYNNQCIKCKFRRSRCRKLLNLCKNMADPDVDFTNPEEVNEFLTNTEIEYMYGCHKENDPDSCFRLGEFFETIRKQWKDAADTYKMCCDKFQNATCCFKAGQYHMLGKGGLSKDWLDAFKCYETACNQDRYQDQGKNDRMAAACCNKGLLMYKDGGERKRIMEYLDQKEPSSEGTTSASTDSSDSKAFPVILSAFQKACNLNDGKGCYFLAQLHLVGYGAGELGKDGARAADCMVKACDLGDVRACHNASLMYSRGDGVEKNPELAKKYQDKVNEHAQGSFSLQFGADGQRK